MSNLTGQSFGRYHILEQLGEGGMAVVYKAYDTRLETEVAVKVIRTERLAPEILEQSLKRFEREAKALAKLTHPNIVKVTDYGEHQGQPYLVMPYLPGGTLKESLKTGQIPWQDAVQLLLPIAGALEYAHEQNLIHRDVKPSNILLTVKGQPMLTDFGIAKVFDLDVTAELTGTGMVIGTPEYMAPEQWMGKVSAQTDIYSLGIVFYELVAGRKPYMADTPAALLLKQANDPLPRPRSFVSGLPDAVEKVLLKALAKNPEDRYQGMGEMVKALEELLAGKPAKEAEPARRVKEETLTAVEFEPGEKTQVDEKPSVREKSKGRWWVWGGVSAGIVLLILAIVLASNLGSFNLFPTATATASLIPLPTLTITSSSTPEPTFTPTETITPSPMPTSSPMPTPTTMVMNIPQTNVRILRANLNSLELLATWDIPFRPLSVDISADNQKIVFGGDDDQINGLVNLRNVQTGEEESLVIFPKNTAGYPGSQVSAVKFLPSGNIAFLMMQSDALYIYDQAGNQVNEFFIKNYGDLTKSLDVSPDGRLIAAGGCCDISIWDTESGTLIMSIAETNPVISLVFSHDGKSIITKNFDGYIRIWDARDGSLLREIWRGFSFALDVSPTGTHLASGSVRSENYQDSQYSGDIRIWRISDGQQVCVNNDILDTGNGWSHEIRYEIEYSPDGSIIAALWEGWGTGGIAFYNPSNCALIRNIDGLSPSMGDLEFSPDGKLAIIAYQDGTIQFFGISR